MRLAPASSLVLLPLLATILGCSGSTSPPTSVSRGAEELAAERLSPTEDDLAGGWADFYPLALGNRWRYEHTFTMRLIPNDGSPPDFSGEGWWIERSMDCERTLEGVPYLVESWRDDFTGQNPLPPNQWVAYRQDRSGLYEADGGYAAPCDPAAAAHSASSEATPRDLVAFDQGWQRLLAGPNRLADGEGLEAAVQSLRERVELVLGHHGLGASPASRLPGELKRLRYPLHVRQHWVINRDIDYHARVTRIGPLVVPAGRFLAHEVEYFRGFLGPSDRVRLWYSRQGELAFDAHLVADWVDPGGAVVGTVETDIRSKLVEHSLVRSTLAGRILTP